MNQQLNLFNQGSVQALGRNFNGVRGFKTATPLHDSLQDLAVDKPYRNGLNMLLPWEENNHGNS